MTKLSNLIVVTFAIVGLAGGCKKKGGTEDQPAAGSGTAVVDPGSAAGSADPAAGSTDPAATADDTSDRLVIVADHTDKTKGTVDVVFTGVKVVKADFDPATIEGGTAALEVDLATLSSGIDKRDAHLKSPDYLDVGKFATLSIAIDNVKKTGDNAFSADATVKLRDIEKKYPVAFQVVDQQATSIRVTGEAKFSRADFKVGKDADDPVAADLIAKLHLTLAKS